MSRRCLVSEMFERTNRAERESQVSVKINWRTRWGGWRNYTTFTG